MSDNTDLRKELRNLKKEAEGKDERIKKLEEELEMKTGRVKWLKGNRVSGRGCYAKVLGTSSRRIGGLRRDRRIAELEKVLSMKV